MTPPINQPYIVPFIWGLIILWSWAGWGGSLARALALDTPDAPAGWGLQAAVGAAGFIAVGGLLNCLRLCFAPVLIAMVVAGCCVHLFQLLVARRSATVGKLSWKARACWIAGPTLLAIYRYASSVNWRHEWNWWDDLIAYVPFPFRMLQTGTLIEPFGLRRVFSFGGQSFLYALDIAVCPEWSIHLIDMGLATLIMAGLVYSLIRPRTHRDYFSAGLLAVLVLAFVEPRGNKSSVQTGAMMLMALIAILQILLSGGDTLRARLGAALVVAATCTLRVIFIPAAFGAVAFFYLARMKWPRESSIAWRACGVRTAQVAILAILLLLPWSITLYESSGTFIYPFMRGNVRPQPEWLLGQMGLAGALAWTMMNLLRLSYLVLPALLATYRPLRAGALAPYVAAIVTSIVVSAGNSELTFSDIQRFIYPMLFASLIATLALFLARPPSPRAWRIAAIIPVVLLSINILGLFPDRFFACFYMQLPQVKLTRSPGDLPAWAEARRMQASIPAGQPILAIVDFPYMLDDGRNQIFNIDTPGAVSPPPGMPFFQGPLALERYLKTLGIHYIAAVNFDRSLLYYNRNYWLQKLAHPEPYWEGLAPLELDMMKNVDALAARHGLYYSDGNLRVIRLN